MPPRPPRLPAGAAPHLTGAGLVVMWSSGFIGAELGTRHAPADTLLMWRFLVAAALLGGVALVLRHRPGARAGTQGVRGSVRRLPPRALAEQSLIGLLSQGVYLGGVVWAAGLGVPAGTSALIAALQPLAAGALAGRLLGERVGRRQWAGLVLGLAGVAAVVRDDLTAGTAAPAAYLLPFAGMAGLLAASFLERRARHRVGALDALPLHCTVSAVFFTALAAAAGEGHTAPPAAGGFWLAVVWVVLLSTFGGYGFYWLSMRQSGVTRTSVLIYLTPPTTLVWAYAMFGERPGPFAVAGMAVAVAGVAVAVRTPAGGGRPAAQATEAQPHAAEEAEARAAEARSAEAAESAQTAPRKPLATLPPAKEPQSAAARYDRHDGNDSRL